MSLDERIADDYDTHRSAIGQAATGSGTIEWRARRPRGHRAGRRGNAPVMSGCAVSSHTSAQPQHLPGALLERVIDRHALGAPASRFGERHARLQMG